MKPFFFFLSILIVLSWSQMTQRVASAKQVIHVQTILHENGSRTESRRNPDTRVLEEFYYGINKRLKNRKLFQLDEEGRALQGLIFDARDNLVGRVEFDFDEFGRLREERSLNQKGRPTQRIIYRYNNKGERLKPLAYNFEEKAGGGEAREVPQKSARSSLATPGINNMPKLKGDTYIEGRGVPKGMRKVPRISLKGLRKDRVRKK